MRCHRTVFRDRQSQRQVWDANRSLPLRVPLEARKHSRDVGFPHGYYGTISELKIEAVEGGLVR